METRARPRSACYPCKTAVLAVPPLARLALVGVDRTHRRPREMSVRASAVGIAVVVQLGALTLFDLPPVQRTQYGADRRSCVGGAFSNDRTGSQHGRKTSTLASSLPSGLAQESTGSRSDGRKSQRRPSLAISRSWASCGRKAAPQVAPGACERCGYPRCSEGTSRIPRTLLAQSCDPRMDRRTRTRPK